MPVFAQIAAFGSLNVQLSHWHSTVMQPWNSDYKPAFTTTILDNKPDALEDAITNHNTHVSVYWDGSGFERHMLHRKLKRSADSISFLLSNPAAVKPLTKFIRATNYFSLLNRSWRTFSLHSKHTLLTSPTDSYRYPAQRTPNLTPATLPLDSFFSIQSVTQTPVAFVQQCPTPPLATSTQGFTRGGQPKTVADTPVHSFSAAQSVGGCCVLLLLWFSLVCVIICH